MWNIRAMDDDWRTLPFSSTSNASDKTKETRYDQLIGPEVDKRQLLFGKSREAGTRDKDTPDVTKFLSQDRFVTRSLRSSNRGNDLDFSSSNVKIWIVKMTYFILWKGSRLQKKTLLDACIVFCFFFFLSYRKHGNAVDEDDGNGNGNGNCNDNDNDYDNDNDSGNGNGNEKMKTRGQEQERQRLRVHTDTTRVLKSLDFVFYPVFFPSDPL